MAVSKRQRGQGAEKAPFAEFDPVDLELDAKNPRFAAYHSGGRLRERDVIAHLLENDDLLELVESIAANGFLDFEPLIVLGEAGKKPTVIEGNRRAAAIKLLRNPILAADLGVTLPAVSPELEPSLHKARVLVVESRDKARQYIGFKHINGPHKWDSFAKGKFAADWYRAEKKNGVTVKDIAHRLGDRHDTILRLVNGIYVLEQARKNKIFSLEERAPGRPFFFSHLYTALTRPQYREYLGLARDWRATEPTPDPIPAAALPQLKNILMWLFGSEADEVEPIIKSQNPHIKQLGEVLANSIALKRLESSNSLSDAFAEVDSRARKYEDSLIRAVKHAEDAQQLVDAFDGDKALVEYGIRLGKISQILVQAMHAYNKGVEQH